ncbi:Hsp70 family protein [Novosphingobium sp. BW1]|uniref:Hsp70 family protein n=1 Tax=Novosphingobium sp. BW1 TaxID=2592621 RepID=UPI0011DE99B0|nr:Hsp70 family protein [Novosphingobium sp. BW1]TYC86871.1 Hsp70 family protein [Novosphingobium sp. BW1]
MVDSAHPTLGIDFGTTNSVMALAVSETEGEMIRFAAPAGASSVFRSALCFWQEEGVRGGLAHEAGPWAIEEFLEFPQGSRFIQSFKSVAANPAFETAGIFEKRYRFEDMGKVFLDHLLAHAGDALRDLPERIVVGRPVRYVGARADAQLARTRYDAMFASLGREVHYVYEPVGAAFSFASRLSEPATLMVADFGGGTSDFSIVRVEAPGTMQRCTPLAAAGIGLAGDRFDFRIMDNLVLPQLGKGGTYRSFDKVLEIPPGHFTDFADWSRLAMMRNKRTLEQLNKLKQNATDPASIARMIAVIENELGFGLYEAVGALKRALSSGEQAVLDFESEDLRIHAEVARPDFESWIAPDLARIGETVDEALGRAALAPEQIDHVFLTGGSSLIPAVRRLFVQRFGEARLASGDELTSIAHGLAMIGQSGDLAQWSARDEV